MSRAEISVGTVLRTSHPPIEPLDLAWFLVATDDRNRIHVDTNAASVAGFPDLVVQGMYLLGLIGANLTSRFGPTSLTRLGADFTKPTFPGGAIVAEYRVTEREELGDHLSLSWRLSAFVNEEQKLRGYATTIHNEEPEFSD